jgi:transposase
MSYHANALSLTRFIERAARRNLIDWGRAEHARRLREAAWAGERARVAENPTVAGPSHTTPADIWPHLLRQPGPLTDHQWAVVGSLLPRVRSPQRSRGRPTGPLRPIFDGVIAMLRGGRRWQDLPRRYPRYRTCHRHFRDWCRSGALRNALDRLEADLGRTPRSRF